MASNSKKTETKRLNKERKAGKKRKRALAVKGSTRSPAELFGDAPAK